MPSGPGSSAGLRQGEAHLVPLQPGAPTLTDLTLPSLGSTEVSQVLLSLTPNPQVCGLCGISTAPLQL